MNEYQEFNQKSLAVFLIGRQRWRDALAAATSLGKAKTPSTRVVAHALAGHAQLKPSREWHAMSVTGASQNIPRDR
ncbi:MAG TPA: hypothetical protein VGO53_13240 [Steroidobacteraceae bacterium]|nr:hypothetical protein [Steroidobacteraceae bacterium]